jgi:hypothetical protein
MVLALCSDMVQVIVISRSECLVIHGNLLDSFIVVMLFSFSCIYRSLVFGLHVIAQVPWRSCRRALLEARVGGGALCSCPFSRSAWMMIASSSPPSEPRSRPHLLRRALFWRLLPIDGITVKHIRCEFGCENFSVVA